MPITLVFLIIHHHRHQLRHRLILKLHSFYHLGLFDCDELVRYLQAVVGHLQGKLLEYLLALFRFEVLMKMRLLWWCEIVLIVVRWRLTLVLLSWGEIVTIVVAWRGGWRAAAVDGDCYLWLLLGGVWICAFEHPCALQLTPYNPSIPLTPNNLLLLPYTATFLYLLLPLFLHLILHINVINLQLL